jgi:hypothetical protein
MRCRRGIVERLPRQTPEWKMVPVVEELRVNCLVDEKYTTIGGDGDGLSRINTAGSLTTHPCLSGIS